MNNFTRIPTSTRPHTYGYATSFILLKRKPAAGSLGWAAQGMERCDGQDLGDEDDLPGEADRDGHPAK